MQTSFMKWSQVAGVSAIAMIALAGCPGADTTGDGNRIDSQGGVELQQGANAAGNVADNMGTAAGNVATAAGNQVQGAGNAVGNAASDVAGATRSVVMTPNVKEAIGDKIPNSAINVDTNGTTKTITLKGVVANAAQVKLAGDTAKKEAPDYKIVNNLKAAGKTSPMMKKP